MAAEISRRALIAGGIAVTAMGFGGTACAQTRAGLAKVELIGQLAPDEELVGCLVQRQAESALWLLTGDNRLMGLMSWPGQQEGVLISRGSRVWLARQKGFCDDGDLHYAVRARVLRWADANTAEARHARAVDRIRAMRNSSWVNAYALSSTAEHKIELQLHPNEGEKIMAQVIRVRMYGDLRHARYGETFKVRLGYAWHGWDIFGARRIQSHSDRELV